MDFDLSKENIQPLRGGRNVSQLEVGLQAQHNPQYQQELLQQKQQFEHEIRTYTGDDPLENYYQYIYWVEQSFPKHGHEGNLVNLLEDCLGRFENDERYQNDPRLCKLWIRYIDMQQNHTELYQLLYSKRICIGCAELYKAWAYYHEAAQDYKRADQVFKLGKQELAQPMKDLEDAHYNFIYNAGSQLINGADSKRLMEQRQALTKLQTSRGGQVGSVRVASTSSAGAGMLPMAQGRQQQQQRWEPTVNLHEDYRDILLGMGAPPASILTAVKRDAPKENIQQVTVWNAGLQKTGIGHKQANIQIHEDAPTPPHVRGLQLPANLATATKEDFSQWHVPVSMPEPYDASKLAMYCKTACYADPTTEFSIEEVRLRRYERKMKRQLSIDSSAELDHASQRAHVSMELGDTSSHSQHSHHLVQTSHSLGYTTAASTSSVGLVASTSGSHPYTTSSMMKQPTHSPMSSMHAHPSTSSQPQYHSPHPPHIAVNHHAQYAPMPATHAMQMPHHPMGEPITSYPTPDINSSYRTAYPYEHHQFEQHTQMVQHQVPSTIQHPMHHQHLQSHIYTQQPHASPHYLVENSCNEPKTYTNLTLQSPGAPSYAGQMRTLAESQLQLAPTPGAHLQQQQHAAASTSFGKYDDNHQPNFQSLWKDDSMSVITRPTLSNFPDYEQSPMAGGSYLRQPHHVEPKGNAMKTPIKMLTDDELAETGSRGGLDVAAAAQPTDGAKRLPIDDEDSITGFDEPYKNDMSYVNTQQFNFDVVHVSTPVTKEKQHQEAAMSAHAVGDVKSTKKRLFNEPGNALSAIIEESNCMSSGSSGSTGSHSGAVQRSVFGLTRPPMESISEQNYQFNLSQNMKANAELRLKLGMDCESGPSSPKLLTAYECQDKPPISDTLTHYVEEEPQTHVPYAVLNFQPTDPFTSKSLETFLRHVNFPGRHRRHLLPISGVPKLAVKKDVCYVGKDAYVCDKLLGKGTYGNVFRATRCDSGAVVALKIQKPPNKWEYYICREIQARLADNPLKECFMSVHYAYFSDLASVLVSDVHNGSLLNLINELKSSKANVNNSQKHQLAIYLTAEMMRMVQALHQVHVIHADIKPDNFLIVLQRDSLRLQLIDFGCSIDMSLLPAGTTFMRKVKTDGFQCCEMKDDRPWSYHTDYFCIAATAHVLLFENYIDLKKVDGRWCITKKIPRYYRDDLWSLFFSSMLNMQEGLPDIEYLITYFLGALDHKDLRIAINYVTNLFRNR